MMFHEQLPRNSLMMFGDVPSNLHYLHFVVRRFSSHVAEYPICFLFFSILGAKHQNWFVHIPFYDTMIRLFLCPHEFVVEIIFYVLEKIQPVPSPPVNCIFP